MRPGVKVMVTGKGGSGKSTVVTLLARSLAARGFRVLVVDSDESNVTLPRMLGLDPPRTTLVEALGGRSRVSSALLREEGELDWDFAEGGIEGLPEECVSRDGGISLLVIGKVGGFGEGCACPMNALTREFLRRIRLGDGEVVIVDAEAGLEHFGRGVEEACDLILMIVDPTYESLVTAERVREFAGQAGKPVMYVLNKMTPEASKLARDHIGKGLVATIMYDDEIFRLSLEGKPLLGRIPEVEAAASAILEAALQPAG